MRGDNDGQRHRRALFILWLLILLYVVNFSLLSLLQNAAFETGAADLGNMNQAAWYTLHHGYPADTFAGRPIPRFGGHVEPIFYLLAVPYAVHQSANTLLILQTVAIALGAVAAYMLGRDVLGRESAGLAFAFVYLLVPSLQAANLTEFHPVTLAAPLFLYAFYYLQKGRYLPFALFALLAMSTKEDMSLLVAMLGIYVLVSGLHRRVAPPTLAEGWARTSSGDRVRTGLAAAIIGVGWFIVCVYIIIPHFSTSGEVVLFQRYAEVGGSPQGLLATLLRNPLAVLARLVAPEKLGYLAGLLASAGFLSLAAPWTLILAAPSLGINMLSNYAPMYSGLSHYSAPIVPFVIIGAIYGAHFLCGVLEKRLRLSTHHALLLVLGWLLLTATAYQAVVGFTPLSLQYRIPRVTAHDRLVSRFVQQIPATAALSVQTPLHPHLSSRAVIYPFPVINDADFVLVDVTARPTMHPNDLKDAVSRLIGQEGFGIVDAADGYILLQKGNGQTELPRAFYSAFLVDDPKPQYPVVINFGPNLRLLGYDIEDVDEGRQPWTRTRLYWQVLGPVPGDLRLYPYYVDDDGRIIEDTTQRPLVSPLWYPPSLWKQGDTIVVQTLPWPLGDHFSLAVGVMQGNNWANRAARLSVHLVQTTTPVRPLEGGTAVVLGRFERVLTKLQARQRPAPRPSQRTDATFADQIRLLGYDLRGLQGRLKAGQTVEVTLYWQALVKPDADYHTFAHIYDTAGHVAAQSDGVTGEQYPISWWLPGQVVTETRTIAIPSGTSDNLSPSVSVGLYRLDDGRRLPVSGRDGRLAGDAFQIALPQK